MASIFLENIRNHKYFDGSYDLGLEEGPDLAAVGTGVQLLRSETIQFDHHLQPFLLSVLIYPFLHWYPAILASFLLRANLDVLQVAAEIYSRICQDMLPVLSIMGCTN